MTAHPNDPMLALQRIEARRRALNLSRQRLANAAGLCLSGYNKAIATGSARTGTVARLRLALARLAGPASELTGDAERFAYHIFMACLLVIAMREGLSMQRIVALDPRQKATANPEWLQAARARQSAYYLANVGLGVPQGLLARATGITPQAVSLAIRRIEDERDGDADNALDQLALSISGGQWYGRD